MAGTLGELERLETLTGLPVRSTPRLPHEQKPHPSSDVLVGAPMTANSVAKLALGIADNQALTVLWESVATVPMIIFPRVNARMLGDRPGTTTSTGSAQSASN
jgi:phosphopantothenoylcysteine synthetase/decarboxylase